MSYFNNLVLTTKGQEMLLSSNTNIDKIITFTNASLGSEKLLPEEIKKAIEVKKSWIKIPLNTVRVINEENNYFLRTEIAFTNAGITENKIMRELGIYAKFESEDEVLFAYSVTDDDGETIPKEDIVPATYKFTIDATISTETKINQIINPEGFLTKEVIELLKYHISNIAVQRIKGSLKEGQTLINITTDDGLISTLSQRLQLFIGGELYSEGIDYTVNTHNNTIQLNSEYSFKEGTIFEIIDNLPPGYVKELLDEFFIKVNAKEQEILENLKIATNRNIESIKELSKKIIAFLEENKINIEESLNEKIEEFYVNLDRYIEENKENLKGKSLYQSWLDIGNIGSETDFVEAMKIKGDDGIPGRGIVNTTIRKGEGRKRIITIFYTDDTTTELEIEDGKSAYEVWKSMGNPGTETDFFKSLRGANLEYSWRGTELGIRVEGDIEYSYVDLKGLNFNFSKTYSSLAQMEADFSNEDVGIGEYVIISSNDNDNAKLFEKRSDGFFFIVQIALRGKSAYEIWLELGNEGTKEDFINSLKGVGVVDREFVRVDAEGNYVYRDIYSDGTKSSEYISPRGPRGYTGGIVGLPDDAEPQPPMTDIYGTIIEHHGSQVPEGWALCNGAYLSGNKYPHLLGMFDDATEPLDVRYKFIDYNHVKTTSSGGNGYYWKRNDMICGGSNFKSNYFRYGNTSYNFSSLSNGTFFSNGTSVYNSNSRLIYDTATFGDNTTKEVLGYISDLEITSPNDYMYIRALAFDGKNFEYGGLLPDSDGRTGSWNRNLHPDIYFNIEYIDEDSGDWRLGVQLHNKTDFIKSNILDNMYIAEIKTTFKTKKIRLSIDFNKSTPHYPMSSPERVEGYGMYFLGRFHTYIDDVPNRENMTVIKLPNLKDTEGRYKLVYIGQPLEITEPTMYSYSKDNIFNGEVPLSLAVNNELPNYTEGITMTEPQPSRMGYANKYNNDTDTWELVKTHLDKEGYYYDEKGDLKYIYKPHNWFKWDFETHTWIEDTLLKEEAKNELLNKYIELELKKDKIIQLKLNTEDIEKQIKMVKQELEVFNG